MNTVNLLKIPLILHSKTNTLLQLNIIVSCEHIVTNSFYKLQTTHTHAYKYIKCPPPPLPPRKE